MVGDTNEFSRESKCRSYSAAGATWANLNFAANDTNGFTGTSLYITNTDFSTTSVGYTVGGGFEWAMIQNFLFRAEYLYYQFSNPQNVVAQDTTGDFPTYPSNYVWGNTSVNAVRAGLVYKI